MDQFSAPVALLDESGTPINPATKEMQASIAGLALPLADSIYAAYPDDHTEVYTYKLSGLTVATLTVVYSDSSKTVLTSAVVT